MIFILKYALILTYSTNCSHAAVPVFFGWQHDWFAMLTAIAPAAAAFTVAAIGSTVGGAITAPAVAMLNTTIT